MTLDSPPGITRPVDGGELDGPADERHVGTEVRQDARVLADVALKGEDADARAVRAHVRAAATSRARRAGAARRGR